MMHQSAPVSFSILALSCVLLHSGRAGKVFPFLFFVRGFTCGPHGTDQQQTTDWGRPERAGVTDGLRLPASPLISSEEKPETHGLKGCRADEQVGRQTDRRTNASIGRHPESRQTHRQMYRQRLQTGSVSVQGAGDTPLQRHRRTRRRHSDDTI